MIDELVQFSQKALIIKDNKLLIIKKSSKDFINPNKWDCPGGRKQEGESVDEHIKREVMEEVSIEVVPKEVFDLWDFYVEVNGKKITTVSVSRFCELKDDNIQITEDCIDGYEWATIDETLLEYNFISGIRHTIEKLVDLYKSK